MKIVLAALNAKYIHSSLALKYLKASVQDVCTNTVTKDYTINNGLLDMLSDLYSEQPDIIGLACYIWNIEMTLQLGNLIKKVLPSVTIILGGPEVSYDSDQIMRRNEFIDYIVLGEGEETFKNLLVALSAHKDVKEISGVTFRNGQGIVEGVPQTVKSLDTIQFPYSNEDMLMLKDKIIYYESSRGCPFSCQYCLSSATNGVRFLSLERVLEDLSFFIRHNVRQVKFVDRTFNARKEHYWPILQFLAKQQCQTNFHFEIAADILDQEVLSFLKEVEPGRMQFEIGIQSTYEPALKEIQRCNNWSKITDSVAKIISYGNIHVHLDLIVGLPYETYEQFAVSFNDVYSLKPHMLQIGFLKLLRGSGIRENAQTHKYVFMESAPYEVLANRYLDYSKLRKLKIFEEVFNQVYNSGKFKYVLPFLIEIHGKNAFAFYQDLTAYWEEHQYHLVAHSTKSLYKYLLDFCREYHIEYEPCCLEVLKFNALMTEKGTLRPDFLPWNEEKWSEEKNNLWRDENLLKRYIPEYTFTNWREVKRQYYIEVFSTEALGYIGHVSPDAGREAAILFSYEREDAVWQYIDPEDFWGRGCAN